jgi:hypothetical protein
MLHSLHFFLVKDLSTSNMTQHGTRGRTPQLKDCSSEGAAHASSESTEGRHQETQYLTGKELHGRVAHWKH